MQPLIRANNLCKRYGSETALDGLSLELHRGECLAVFGLSGAGKSTLVRLLAGIEPPDFGSVTLSYERAAVSSQTPLLDGMLTPMEALSLGAVLHGIPRAKRRAVVREALAFMGLESERNRHIGRLPSGARKLLELAPAIFSPAEVLLLDEPFAGLDPDMRTRLWEHLLKLRARCEKGIVLATSRPDDAELCDRIILLHGGRVLSTGTLGQLRAMAGPEALIIEPAADKAAHRGAGGAGIVAREKDGSITVELDPDTRPADLLARCIMDVSAVRIRPRGLGSVLEELVARSEAPSDRTPETSAQLLLPHLEGQDES